MVSSKRESWLVHHYCQGLGLANCLRMLCRGIEVEVVDQFSTPQHRDKVSARIESFDRVIAEPSIARRDPIMARVDPGRMLQLPTLRFSGYHPDLVLLWHAGKPLDSPTGNSHSMIAYCAFSKGIDERAVPSLFREEVFDACGYFDQWERSRALLLESFSEHGFDVSGVLVEWSRRGPFMHSIIHPYIACLRDIARMILDRVGMDVVDTRMLPVDNLAMSEGLPVYPEIALRLGIQGNYLFKLGNRYEVVDLQEYVGLAYKHYRRMPEAVAHPGYVDRFEQARNAIAEMA